MSKIRLAGIYAKSLIDLATQQNQLELAYADMKFFQAVSKASKDFVNVLRSPIINADQKNAIINAISKDNVSALTNAFTNLLVKKGREAVLPEIADAFVEQYNALKGIHEVTLTTAVAINETVKNAIENKIKSETNFSSIELTTKTDESIIGGFVLEFDNNILDASIARDLKDIKKQFLNNEFVSKI